LRSAGTSTVGTATQPLDPRLARRAVL